MMAMARVIHARRAAADDVLNDVGRDVREAATCGTARTFRQAALNRR